MTSGVRTRVAYGRVLIVEDQFAMYRCVARIVSRYRPVRHAESYEKAVHELSARRDWCGFLFDVSLGDHGNGGFELAQLATKDYPGVPIAIITGGISPDVVNRAAALGVTLVSKPLGEQELLPFLQRVIAREHGFNRDFADRLDAVSREWKLSPREHEIVAWFVSGGSREGYLRFTGLAETTLKTHVKHLLAKTQRQSIPDVVSAALRRILVQTATKLPVELDVARMQSDGGADR